MAVPEVRQDTHTPLIGYLLWLFGFTGSHRFYFGKPVTGAIWACTAGLLGIGWLIDLFLIPSMDRQADLRFRSGRIDYNIAWILLTFLGQRDDVVASEVCYAGSVELFGQHLPRLGIEVSLVDTSDVEPMAHPLQMSQRLREDRVTEENQRELFQSIAPATANGLYLVPKVIE